MKKKYLPWSAKDEIITQKSPGTIPDEKWLSSFFHATCVLLLGLIFFPPLRGSTYTGLSLVVQTTRLDCSFSGWGATDSHHLSFIEITVFVPSQWKEWRLSAVHNQSRDERKKKFQLWKQSAENAISRLGKRRNCIGRDLRQIEQNHWNLAFWFRHGK